MKHTEYSQVKKQLTFYLCFKLPNPRTLTLLGMKQKASKQGSIFQKKAKNETMILLLYVYLKNLYVL